MLIAGLKDGTIKIYDIRTHQEIFTLADFKGDLANVSFSNKGLSFAAAWKSESVCRVFNLRKLGKEVAEIRHKDNLSYCSFDNFGSYLMTAAGSSLNVFTANTSTKKWDDATILFSNE